MKKSIYFNTIQVMSSSKAPAYWCSPGTPKTKTMHCTSCGGNTHKTTRSIHCKNSTSTRLSSTTSCSTSNSRAENNKKKTKKSICLYPNIPPPYDSKPPLSLYNQWYNLRTYTQLDRLLLIQVVANSVVVTKSTDPKVTTTDA